MKKKTDDFLNFAIDEAKNGVESGDGGPFGAVIVKNGVIISSAHNEVIGSNDPTAHAEILAIRRASEKLGRFDLSDCEIYSTCEPCPMCFSAIHWAKIKKLYYGCTNKDAAKIGFDDKFIYDVIKGDRIDSRLQSIQINREKCLILFKLWDNKTDKIPY
jgi:guanine deaminase